MTTFRARHLLGIEQLSPTEITTVLDLADRYVDLNRRTVKQSDALAGLTQINMFFENSTRTQASFELAGKRLGADVMNMSVAQSSVKKGETLIDTAMTLNAMHPDLLVVRHGASGAVNLLAQKVDCAVLNAGDGRHEHPTQALLDALTIRRHKGRLDGLKVAVFGDIEHSRVVRSNIHLLTKMGATVTVGGPRTLVPPRAITDQAAAEFVRLAVDNLFGDGGNLGGGEVALAYAPADLGIRELGIVEDGVTGTLFAPDNPEAIADALAKLLENRGIWAERRRTARIFVETHRNWSSNILRYEPVYQRLLRGAA